MSKTIGKKRTDAFTCRPEHLIIIGLDTTDTVEHHLWDERAFLPLSQETINNFLKIGVKEAVIVTLENPTDLDLTDEALARLSGETEGIPKHMGDVVGVIIDGRRRTLHSRAANDHLRENDAPTLYIPVDVDEGSEETDLLLMSMTLNNHREDDDPITMARKGKALYDRNGKDKKEVCDALKMAWPRVKRYFRLLQKGSLEVKAAVRTGEVGATAAIEFAERLPKKHQDEVLIAAREKTKKAKKDDGEGGVKTISGTLLRKMILDREDLLKKGNTPTGTGSGNGTRNAPNRTNTPQKRVVRDVMTCFEQVPSQTKVSKKAVAEAEFVVNVLAWILDGSKPPASVQSVLDELTKAKEVAKETKKAEKEKAKADKAAKKAKAAKAKAAKAKAAQKGKGGKKKGASQDKDGESSEETPAETPAETPEPQATVA